MRRPEGERPRASEVPVAQTPPSAPPGTPRGAAPPPGTNQPIACRDDQLNEHARVDAVADATTDERHGAATPHLCFLEASHEGEPHDITLQALRKLSANTGLREALPPEEEVRADPLPPTYPLCARTALCRLPLAAGSRRDARPRARGSQQIAQNNQYSFDICNYASRESDSECHRHRASPASSANPDPEPAVDLQSTCTACTPRLLSV